MERQRRAVERPARGDRIGVAQGLDLVAEDAVDRPEPDLVVGQVEQGELSVLDHHREHADVVGRQSVLGPSSSVTVVSNVPSREVSEDADCPPPASQAGAPPTPRSRS